MTATATHSSVRPPGGRKKGFEPDSWSSYYYQGIVQTFVDLDLDGAFTIRDFAFWLHARVAWIKRPLARLVEEGLIVAQPPTMMFCSDQVVREVVYYKLNKAAWARTCAQPDQEVPGVHRAPPQDMTVAGIELDDDCRACEQVSAGRGSCASCSRRGR